MRFALILLSVLLLLLLLAGSAQARKKRQVEQETEEDQERVCLEKLLRCQRLLDTGSHVEADSALPKSLLERAKGSVAHLIEVFGAAEHTADSEEHAKKLCREENAAALLSEHSFQYRLRRGGESDVVCTSCACVLSTHDRIGAANRRTREYGVYRDGTTVVARIEDMVTGSVDNYFFLLDPADGRVTHIEHDRIIVAPRVQGTSKLQTAESKKAYAEKIATTRKARQQKEN